MKAYLERLSHVHNKNIKAVKPYDRTADFDVVECVKVWVKGLPPLIKMDRQLKFGTMELQYPAILQKYPFLYNKSRYGVFSKQSGSCH
jgi:hypothetical protein